MICIQYITSTLVSYKENACFTCNHSKEHDLMKLEGVNTRIFMKTIS